MELEWITAGMLISVASSALRVLRSGNGAVAAGRTVADLPRDHSSHRYTVGKPWTWLWILGLPLVGTTLGLNRS